MRHPLTTSLLAIAAAAIAGCGGGDGDSNANMEADAMATTAQFDTATSSEDMKAPASMDFVNQLIGQTSETTEPEPVDNTPLPTDDSV